MASGIGDNRRYVTKKVNRVEELLQKHKNLFQNKKGCCTLVRANFLSKTSSFLCHYWWSGQRIRLTGEIGFIQTVNYSTWEASTIVWQKVNRTIWLCAYFSKGLNDAIQNHSYNLFARRLFIKLNVGRYLSKLDLSEVYLQVEVGEDAKDLLNNNIYGGLQPSNRIPFGLCPASA